MKKLKNNAFSDCYIFIKYKINIAVNKIIFNLNCFNLFDFKINKYFVLFYDYKKQNTILLLQSLFLMNKINLFLKMFEIFGELLRDRKLNINKCY